LPTLFFPQSSIPVNDLRLYAKKTHATKLLDFSVHHVDTVELNNSFYRFPPARAFDCWRQASPANFVFRVKASRFITHNKKEVKRPGERYR
jgi:uncharacterized protein YecE (DUF72 family)